MIDLYYWTTPNGHKITIFLEEAQLDYNIKLVNIGKGEQFEPEFLKISPNNRIPAIIDNSPVDGGEPISIFESGAILLYLAQKINQFLPADIRGEMEVMQWLFWQMGGLGPMLGQNHHFFRERERLTYESNYHICKSNENYRILHTDIAQQTMKVVDRSMKSFLGLLKAISIGRCDQRPQLPKYLPKDGYFPLIIPRIKVKDGVFKIPMSRQFKKEYGEVKIQLPERLNDKNIKEVRIHPKYSARWFEIEYIYEDEKIETSVTPDKAIAIDLGVDNLAACCDTEGHQFLIDGKRLKSINQWYNKRNAELQSLKDEQRCDLGDSHRRRRGGSQPPRGSAPREGIKGFTHQQARLYQWRNDRVRDYLNKTARIIINHCLTHQKGFLSLKNPRPKSAWSVNLFDSYYQFVCFPFSRTLVQ